MGIMNRLFLCTSRQLRQVIMKKTILILFVILMAVSSLPATSTASSPYSWLVVGYIGTNASMRVTLNTDLLPFDVESNEAKKNTDTANVRGIHAGNYSLFCNNSFSLKVYHDYLVHSTDTSSYVDYRLDLFYSDSGQFKTAYHSTADSGFITITSSDLGSVPPFAITNKAFYVSMNASANEISELTAGTYSSTIVFVFTTEN